MNPAQAEEQLRVIRNLMERATIYRAISAPTALVGGILSILASILALDGSPRFIAGWLLVLLLTLVANTWFIWQKARREGGKIFSSGLRLAIRSALPVLLVTVVLTITIWRMGNGEGAALLMATQWALFYGLALLSTATFAPRSLIFLGWTFLATGLIAPSTFHLELTHHRASWLMGLSFGGYHLAYAICTWPRKGAAEAPPMSIE
jgi:hypothetical protein